MPETGVHESEAEIVAKNAEWRQLQQQLNELRTSSWQLCTAANWFYDQTLHLLDEPLPEGRTLPEWWIDGNVSDELYTVMHRAQEGFNARQQDVEKGLRSFVETLPREVLIHALGAIIWSQIEDGTRRPKAITVADDLYSQRLAESMP
jgi:hypothetical protein